MPEPAANNHQQIVITVLRGKQSAEEFCQARGIDRATYTEQLNAYLAKKVPPVSATWPAAVARRVEIVRDHYGIPHVFAQTAPDLFFGFGFALGQDRLWQIDFYRRRAHGTLAEILGRSALASDIQARTLGFRQVAEQELAILPVETRDILEHFVAGINAAIESYGDELPIEFDVLDYRPASWTPLDVLAINRATHWQFSGRVQGIVLAEAAKRLLPVHLAERFLAIELANETIVPGGYAADAQSIEATLVHGDQPQGSNQWAVAGWRTVNGPGALLASDGHVPYDQPSSRYEIHLAGAGYDVIGIALPGMPVLHNGRNRQVAWGATNNVSSGRDLYVEEVDPTDPERYRDGQEFRRFARKVEAIAVRGEGTTELVVRSTVRGPVVNHLIPSVDPAGDPPLSLRWTGLEPTDILSPQLAMLKAEDAESYRQTMAGWAAWTSNAGFADTHGHIGYQMRGRVPLRGRITRGYRAANDPADQWLGFATFESLPREADPARGWIGSANNPPAARDYPVPLYGAYADGYRLRRIRTLLESQARFTLDDLARFQADTFVQRAADVCPALVRTLAPRAAETPRLDAAITALRDWDYCFELTSVGASIYQIFWDHWTKRVAAERFPEHLRGLAASGTNFVAHELICQGNDGWFASQTALEQAIHQTMAASLRWLADRLGPDVATWEWGRLHPVTFRHPLAEQFPALADVVNVGPFPCPGTTGALNQQGFVVGERLATVSGPQYRLLVDLSSPSQALGCNTTGNSGHPGSRHYADQSADWLQGRYHPLLMDRAEIEQSAEGRTILAPS